MTDREALIAAVIANPTEDTPKLVYADWLDDNDDLLRANTLRWSVELGLEWGILARIAGFVNIGNGVSLFPIGIYTGEIVGPKTSQLNVLYKEVGWNYCILDEYSSLELSWDEAKEIMFVASLSLSNQTMRSPLFIAINNIGGNNNYFGCEGKIAANWAKIVHNCNTANRLNSMVSFAGLQS